MMAVDIWCSSLSPHPLCIAKIHVSIHAQFLIPLTKCILFDQWNFWSDRFWKYSKMGKILLRQTWQIGQWALMSQIRKLLPCKDHILLMRVICAGMWWWDVYIWELNCLTCSWASFVPLPLLYVSSHHIVSCSHFLIVFTSTDARAFRTFSLRVSKV